MNLRGFGYTALLHAPDAFRWEVPVRMAVGRHGISVRGIRGVR